MATKIGDLFFDVYADTKRAGASVDALVGKMQSAGAAAARAIGDTIANAIGITTAATVALGVATVNLGVHYNTLGQSASAAFSSIYNDVEAAHDILSRISQLDLETPFSGSSLTATARTLAGFSFDLEDVVDTTEALAQATAAMGLGSDALHRMAIAFGQIQSRGKLAGDEARQLANYGIDVYGLLAEKIGLTVAQVRELGSESKLTADFVIPLLVDAINERFSGATEALFATVAGQAEGLRSIVEGVGSAIVQPFIGFAGGGAAVDAMNAIRVSLLDLVSVAEDGSFKLEGFLKPLEPLLAGLADNLRDMGESVAAFFDGISDTALTDLFADLEGIGPLIAAAGAALLTVTAQAIPFLGRLVAGFNPVVVAVVALIAASSDLRAEFSDALGEIAEVIEPLVPKVQELLESIVDLAEDAGPAVADILVAAFQILGPIIEETIDIVSGLLPVLGPTLLAVLKALEVVLEAIAFVLQNETIVQFVIFAGVLYKLSVLFPITTAGIVALTATTATSGTVASLSATKWGFFATAIGVVGAAYGSIQAVTAGVRGDIDYLNREVSLFEKPFQIAGRAGFSIGQSLRGEGVVDQLLQQIADEQMKGFAAAENFDVALLGQVDSFREARQAALEYAGTLGLGEDAAINFANAAALAWREQTEAAEVAAHAAEIVQNVLLNALEEFRDAGGELPAWAAALVEPIDLMAALEVAARQAREEVDRLAMIGPEATVDDFLRELPGLAQDVTDAMAETGPELIRNLNVEGALQDVEQAARSVVQTLARDYGMSMAEIREHLSSVGDVTAVLSQITEDTTESVDPLIAKYAQLGATAEQVRSAIGRLNDQRTTAIRAQIDQVEAALRDAKEAAQDARDAVEDFISGGYLTGPQALVDDLIMNVGSIGSAVEEGLKVGGIRGDAIIRSAFGDAQGQIAKIVMAGLEAGMSGQQIVDLLGPVLGAINEEVSDARNRISSLDWTEGFTGTAGGMLVQALQRGLDPGAIQDLIGGILGADATVAGLEGKLESLQTAMSAEVEFSAEQVQAELDKMTAETEMTIRRTVISPEAAQAVFDEITAVLNDDPYGVAVDKAVITDQILDAAKDAEDQLAMVFDSALSFDSAELASLARQVGGEFYAAFQTQLEEIRDVQAQEAGFKNYAQMVSALGPTVAAATIATVQPSITTNINQDIQVNGAQSPLAVGTEIVAAGSAAAGSGGAYDPSKYNRLRVR